MTDTDDITSYDCPECGSKAWYIQNQVAPAAAFFDPEITHVECIGCGHVEEATTSSESDALESLLRELVAKWYDDADGFPDQGPGVYASMLVSAYARELEYALDNGELLGEIEGQSMGVQQ